MTARLLLHEAAGARKSGSDPRRGRSARPPAVVVDRVEGLRVRRDGRLRHERRPPREGTPACKGGGAVLSACMQRSGRESGGPRAKAHPHERNPEVIICHQWSSIVTILSSDVIRCHQRGSEVIRGHHRSSEVIRGHQRSSEAILVPVSWMHWVKPWSNASHQAVASS